MSQLNESVPDFISIFLPLTFSITNTENLARKHGKNKTGVHRTNAHLLKKKNKKKKRHGDCGF